MIYQELNQLSYLNLSITIDEKYVHNLYWMGLTVNAKTEAIKNYPMTIHYDKTCRLQIVKSDNSFYNSLITNLEKIID